MVTSLKRTRTTDILLLQNKTRFFAHLLLLAGGRRRRLGEARGTAVAQQTRAVPGRVRPCTNPANSTNKPPNLITFISRRGHHGRGSKKLNPVHKFNKTQAQELNSVSQAGT